MHKAAVQFPLIFITRMCMYFYISMCACMYFVLTPTCKIMPWETCTCITPEITSVLFNTEMESVLAGCQQLQEGSGQELKSHCSHGVHSLRSPSSLVFCKKQKLWRWKNSSGRFFFFFFSLGMRHRSKPGKVQIY